MKPPRHPDFLLLLTMSLVLWWHPLTSTWRLTLVSAEYTYILLILPLSGALIYRERRSLGAAFEPRLGAGSALLLVALLIAGFAKWGERSLPGDIPLSLSMFALVIWWIGSVLFCYGLRAVKFFLFPLCMLFWIVPMPETLMDVITHFLQLQSAFAARVLFLVAGLPVTQDGILLSIPNLDIQVARECSSIRSSAMLVITTMVLAHLFLRSNWRKGLLIAVAIPIAAMKNGLRIFVISQLGTRVDPGFFDGDLHHRGGVMFFAISLGVMTVLLLGLRQTENLESCGPGVVSTK